jgi:hypothetical protein
MSITTVARELAGSVEMWDGNATMRVVFDDGGREASGRKGFAGDCVARSIAIAAGLPYADVYAALAKNTGEQRAGKRGKRAATARSGINVTRKWFKDYMTSLGFRWTPCMGIGTGCKVHLVKGELPMGRLVVSLSRHYTAVIDGVIHDTFNPTRATLHHEQGVVGAVRISHRCVYGYWSAA